MGDHVAAWFAGWSPVEIVLLVVAAVLVGFAKTAIGGVASISVAIFAATMPARESTGVLLPLLILGDVFAVWSYRKHAHWRTLLRLMPTVVVGILLGAVFVATVDDTVMRRTIGVVLVLLVAVNLWTRSRQSRERAAAPVPAAAAKTSVPATSPADAADAASAAGTRRARHTAAAFYGSLTGFTTMVANAGGPVMSLYMLSMRMPMLAFLGTGAWLFALFNLVKVPFSVGLGLLDLHALGVDLVLAPGVVAGAAVGRWAIRRIDQVLFERVVLVVTVLSAVNLVR
ncbi:sulfite exporter TauE/SafE family protein [Kineosporia sp. A_224]|uniref:sulfite exporter TauE/SafE family protein n=1 Tax=Kineosporia sp. A_224 TaxID=1962180 RepID=UPI0035108180